MIGQSLSYREKDRLAEILAARRFCLKMMYWKLPAPEINEIHGQYEAQLLDQGDRLGGFFTRLAFGSRGTWVGKAFCPLSDDRGEGYNAFGSVETPSIALPMDTYIDHSHITPGLSYILDYRLKNRGPIRWLRGELRQVSSEVLLGIGTFGPRNRKLHRLRRVIPFVLVRRTRDYLPTSSSDGQQAA